MSRARPPCPAVAIFPALPAGSLPEGRRCTPGENR